MCLGKEHTDEKGRSAEDYQVLHLWDKEGTMVDGHHEFPIHFKEIEPQLPDNWIMVKRRLAGLKTRLQRDEILKAKYVAEMEKLLQEGHAEQAKGVGPPGKTWYLPHHPVFNPNKLEKIHIVSDCAASFEGTTLNKQVMQGPDLMNDLLGILLRFRERRIAVAADIKAMFHQVKVTPRDHDVLRFLWWPKRGISLRGRKYIA